MLLFGVGFLIIIAAIVGGIALVVFLCSLPFLLRAGRTANRFGPASTTTSIMGAVVAGLKRTFDFFGRSNRVDFWTFAIAVGSCAVAVLGAFLFEFMTYLYIGMEVGVIWYLALIALLGAVSLWLAIASLSMAVRRLHDVNKSGWWLLLLLVFGYFILLYWFFQPSQKDVADYVEVFN